MGPSGVNLTGTGVSITLESGKKLNYPKAVVSKIPNSNGYHGIVTLTPADVEVLKNSNIASWKINTYETGIAFEKVFKGIINCLSTK